MDARTKEETPDRRVLLVEDDAALGLFPDYGLPEIEASIGGWMRLTAHQLGAATLAPSLPVIAVVAGQRVDPAQKRSANARVVAVIKAHLIPTDGLPARRAWPPS